MARFVRWLVVIIYAAGAHGQAILNDPSEIADAQKFLDTLSVQTAPCAVTPIPPRFTFDLHVRAGYAVEVHLPLDQTRGHQWVILTRISPHGGNRQPVYLSDVISTPARNQNDSGVLPSASFSAPIDGSFWLGEGSYSVKWVMFDESGDVCRKNWRIEAHVSSSERRLQLLAPGVVSAISWRDGSPAVNSAAAARMTVLLNAASLRQGDTLVGIASKELLLDSLAGILAAMPTASVRLVILSLDQQKELFRKDGFTLQSMPEAVEVLNEVPWAVDYHVLQGSSGTVDLIERIVREEIGNSTPANAVVFLGPHAIYKGKPSPDFSQRSVLCPPFFYLEYLNERPIVIGTSSQPYGWAIDVDQIGPPLFPPRTPGISQPTGGGPTPRIRSNAPRNSGPDSIEYAVRQLGGTVLRIDSPLSFARAVLELREKLKAMP